MGKRTPLPFVLASAAALSAGCASGRAAGRAAPAAAPAAFSAGRPGAGEPDVRELGVRAIPELAPVEFAYDSDLLDDAARALLRADADYMKAHPGMTVQVAGHCDQRGTVEYNLALGQSRAAAVRSYYQALGVELTRVATISYGKERPLCAEETDACWARNRRAETLEVLNPNVAKRDLTGRDP